MCGCVNPTPVNARRGGAVRSRSLSCTAPLNVNVPGLLSERRVSRTTPPFARACSLLPPLRSVPCSRFPFGRARKRGSGIPPLPPIKSRTCVCRAKGQRHAALSASALDNDDEQASQISDQDPQHFTFSNGGARSKEHSIGRV